MAGELEGKTILLVDDDRDILAGMQSALADLGPQIVTASDGNDALVKAQEHTPDLVVLDMMLPKRSGFLVLQKLKQGKEDGEVPYEGTSYFSPELGLPVVTVLRTCKEITSPYWFSG